MQLNKKYKCIAPAKINTLLKIDGKDKSTNKHYLTTILQTLSLHDEIFVNISSNENLQNSNNQNAKLIANSFGGTLEVILSIQDSTHTLKSMNVEDNLVFKALFLSFEKSKICKHLKIDIELYKNIPAQAGLGGGSSDCAATLLLCKHIFKLTDLQINNIACSLGSDIKFFLHGGRIKMTGFGEIIEENYQSLSNPIILVKARGGVSTKDCYMLFDKMHYENTEYNTYNNTQNDLEEPAILLENEIGSILDFLKAHSFQYEPMMCGSGSCCYMLCNSSLECKEIEKKAKTKGWWAHACNCADISATFEEI